LNRFNEIVTFGSTRSISLREPRTEKAARLADVAKAAGVSQGTVSNVFNRPELVREEVREHVRAVATKIGYRGPDPRGRLLRAGKVNAIGVATAEPLSYFFDDPFARELLRGMSEACDAAGAGLSLVSAMNDEKLSWNIENALVDGFVLLCIEGGERLVDLTRQRQLPFVALALGKDDPTISAVGTDDVDGARQLAEHLVGLGHRRFAALSLEFTDGHVGLVTEAETERAIYSTSRDRIRGYFDVFRRHGIDVSGIPIWETENDKPTTIAGLEAIFARPERPTALICMSDRVAMIALDWLRGQGIAVPGEVSVVGYDGVPEAALTTPPLTTVTQPIAAIGRRAVEMILDGSTQVRREVLPLELTARGSTGRVA
jgi:DNA-binding LacI/PurR family transcriptional regulator